MLPTEQLKKNLIRLKQGGIQSLVKSGIVKNVGYIKELQTEEQMFEGIRSDGSNITPEYTGFTKRIKASKGDPYDRVTLKDTGDFYKKVYIKLDQDSFALDSSDPKRDELVHKYKPEIFGLTDKNKRKLSERMRDTLLKQIKDRL